MNILSCGGLNLWKIFLCGHGQGYHRTGKNWRTLFKENFGKEHIILQPKEIKSKSKGTVSLDAYAVAPHKIAILSVLSEIKKADLVIANASRPSFETLLQLSYAHMLRKPVVLFAGASISASEIPYVKSFYSAFYKSFDALVEGFRKITVLPPVKHSILRDIMLRGTQGEIEVIFSKEDRKDALFRCAILTTQLGQLLHYLTHDRRINPGARSIGSKADEEAQLGDCLVQLLIYSICRGFNIDRIYSMGTKRMEETVWRLQQPQIAPRELRKNEVGYGISASQGEVEGRVVVITNVEDVSKLRNGKCIVAISEYHKPVWNEIAARIEYVAGLISGTGTPNIHPAIICRELKKPCIVGAKELVTNLTEGDVVRMVVGEDIEENSVTRLTPV